jgi:DNA repair exonuclease SbcCD ATPase subunit
LGQFPFTSRELESIYRREQQKLAEEERRHALTREELVSGNGWCVAVHTPVQKEIGQKEAESAKILVLLEQTERQREKEDKRWKQLKETANRLAEEKEMLERHFKREGTSFEEQKNQYSKQLEDIREVLRTSQSTRL